MLRLAAPATTLTDVLAPFLATFAADDPTPTVLEPEPGGAWPTLRGGIDLAIVTRSPPSSLASVPLARLPVWAYVRADDAWATRSVVPVSELVERRLVLLNPDLRPRTLLDAATEAAGVTYGDYIEVANAQVAQAIAAADRGIAIVSDDPRFDLIPLRIDGPAGTVRIPLYAVWEPGHHAAATISSLAGRLGKFCIERYGADVAPTVRKLVPASSRADSRPPEARASGTCL
jgi:DNA-binding transcriptional LysR family regulator